MKLYNSTGIDTSALERHAAEYDTGDLHTYVRLIRRGAKTPYSGVCYYKRARIRVSINPRNLYPVPVRVGSPFDSRKWRHYMMNSPEQLAEFIFLHELSHYLDYKNGVPVRCKQTKADMFALKRMGLLEGV